MAQQIVIQFDFGAGKKPDFHRVLNFNDALYALALDDDCMSFSLDQIDKKTGQVVSVKSARKLRRASAKIEKLLQEHGFVGIAHLTVANPSN